MLFKFSELAGNAQTIRLIRRSLANDNFRHTTIFAGPRGTGKSSSAHIAAMSLTCECPKDGQPCLSCSKCRTNLAAIQGNGKSPYVRIINLASVEKDGVADLIKEVFEMQSSSQNQVFIFEEAHALKSVKNGYTALLTEIDRMSPNTYIIMCTTVSHDISEELRSRALKFEFKRLNRADCKALADRLIEKKMIEQSRELAASGASSIETLHSLDEKTINLVVGYSKGIPRDLEKLIDFAFDMNASLDEMRGFLQVVSFSSLIEIFSAMAAGDFASVLEQFAVVKEQSTPKQIIEAIKELLVEVVFYKETGSSDEFSPEEKTTVKEIFDGKIGQLVSIVEKTGVSESDLDLALIKMNSIMKDGDAYSMITKNTSNAAKARVDAAKFKTEERVEGKLTPVSLKGLGVFQ